MRYWLSGPRVMGIRPGVSFGREDLRGGAPLIMGAAKVLAWIVVLAVGAAAGIMICIAHYNAG